MTSLTFWFWDVKGPAPGKLLLSKLLSKGEVFERVSPCPSNEIVQCNGDHRRSKLVRLVRKAWPAWRFQSFCVLVLILQHLSWFSEAPLWTSAPPATNCVPIQHEGKSWKRTSHLRLVLAILPSKGEMPVACTEKAKKATSWVGLVLSLSCVSTAPGLNSHNIFWCDLCW